MQKASEKVKKLNVTLQDKEQAMERLEGELRATLGRALEAERDRSMLIAAEVSLRLENCVVSLEQGCDGLCQVLLQLQAELHEVRPIVLSCP